jgi:lipopolysaccharide biosynthesis glycosyltransferase
MVFARIEALNLLRSYDVIIGTDFDVIFKKSILSDVLMNKTMTALGGQVFNSHYFHLTQEEKEYQNKQGFSMGFYIINRVLCDQLVSTDLYSYYLRRCFSIRLPEQACFNFYQQKNQIDVTYLNSSYASNELRSDTVILHSRPNEKFWENLDPEWVIIYEKYISLGGRAMQAKILTRTRSRRKLAMLLHLFSIRLKRKFA